MLATNPKIRLTLLFENDDLVSIPNVDCINVFQNSNLIKQFIEKYVEIRKGKETIEQAQKAMQSRVNIAMMMLATGMVDGVVGGLLYPTSDILRGAFKIIGPKTNIKTISSVMMMHKDGNYSLYSDISVNPDPNSDQLVDIAKNALEFSESLQLFDENKIAFLSFSTDGSASTESTQKVKNATDNFNLQSKVEAIGEVQFDAAVIPSVRKSKYQKSSFDGSANIFVFPDLNSGNIGYKIAQRIGGQGAIGPILVGVNKPVNDLSRGSTVDDVYYTVLITALQAN